MLITKFTLQVLSAFLYDIFYRILVLSGKMQYFISPGKFPGIDAQMLASFLITIQQATTSSETGICDSMPWQNHSSGVLIPAIFTLLGLNAILICSQMLTGSLRVVFKS